MNKAKYIECQGTDNYIHIFSCQFGFFSFSARLNITIILYAFKCNLLLVKIFVANWLNNLDFVESWTYKKVTQIFKTAKYLLIFPISKNKYLIYYNPYLGCSQGFWSHPLLSRHQLDSLKFSSHIYCKINLHLASTNIKPFCCTKPAISWHFMGFLLKVQLRLL